VREGALLLLPRGFMLVDLRRRVFSPEFDCAPVAWFPTILLYNDILWVGKSIGWRSCCGFCQICEAWVLKENQRPMRYDWMIIRQRILKVKQILFHSQILGLRHRSTSSSSRSTDRMDRRLGLDVCSNSGHRPMERRACWELTGNHCIPIGTGRKKSAKAKVDN